MLVPAKGGAVSLRKGRVLKPCTCVSGYEKVTLANGNERKQVNVHLLVITAFKGPRPGKHPEVQARHKNGRRRDNRAANLVWGSALENCHDKYAHGTMPDGRRKLTPKQAQAIIDSEEPGVRLAEKYGVLPNHISAIRHGRTWKSLRR